MGYFNTFLLRKVGNAPQFLCCGAWFKIILSDAEEFDNEGSLLGCVYVETDRLTCLKLD